MRRQLLLLGLALTALSLGTWLLLRASYHEWRMHAAADAIERQANSQYSLAEDLVGFVRGEPLTSREYTERILEHQEVLVQLGRFERRRFPLPAPMPDFDEQDRFVAHAMERISKYARWSVTFSTGATSIVVTETPSRLDIWEQLVRELEARKNTHSAVRPGSWPAR